MADEAITADDKRVQLLAKSRYFAKVSERTRIKMAKVCKIRKFKAGELIVRQGTAADAMYIIASGKVEVFVEDPTTRSERGLGHLRPGHCFGELAVIAGLERSASVRALERTAALEFRADHFQRLMLKVPQVAVAVARTLAKWLHKTDGNLGYRFIKLALFPSDPEVIANFPAAVARTHRVMALCKEEDRHVVAMADPTDLVAIDAIRQVLGQGPIEFVAAERTDMEDYIAYKYGDT